MTATSAASTLGDSWNRQLTDNTDGFAPQPWPRHARSPTTILGSARGRGSIRRSSAVSGGRAQGRARVIHIGHETDGTSPSRAWPKPPL
jgi:hypothetical protein